jgi:hypothetical protein
MSSIIGKWIWTFTFQATEGAVVKESEPIENFQLIYDPQDPPSSSINYNLSVVFSGYLSNLDEGLRQSLLPEIQKQSEGISLKFFCIGGGTNTEYNISIWKTETFNYVKDWLSNNKDTIIQNFQGVCYDIELADDSFSTQFQDLFQFTKGFNLQVMIAISNSAPWNMTNGSEFMSYVFSTIEDIDIISPLMYSGDYGPASEFSFTDTAKVRYPWDNFFQNYLNRKNPTMKLCPSVWLDDLYLTPGTNQPNEKPIGLENSATHYPIDQGVKSFFETYKNDLGKTLSIETTGYIRYFNGTANQTNEISTLIYTSKDRVYPYPSASAYPTTLIPFDKRNYYKIINN